MRYIFVDLNTTSVINGLYYENFHILSYEEKINAFESICIFKEGENPKIKAVREYNMGNIEDYPTFYYINSYIITRKTEREWVIINITKQEFNLKDIEGIEDFYNFCDTYKKDIITDLIHYNNWETSDKIVMYSTEDENYYYEYKNGNITFIDSENEEENEISEMLNIMKI